MGSHKKKMAKKKPFSLMHKIATYAQLYFVHKQPGALDCLLSSLAQVTPDLVQTRVCLFS